MKPLSGRIHFIETLRAWAAMAVMLFHFLCFHNGDQFLFQSKTLRVNAEYGALGVQLFYIISGFVITYALRRSNFHIYDYFRYVLKRILRIHPTYIAVIAFMLLAQYVTTTYVWYGDFWVNKKEVLANITFLVEVSDNYDWQWMNPIFRTLYVEFQFYLAIGLLFPLLDKSRSLRLVFFCIILAFSYYEIGHDNALSNAPYFITGYLLMDLHMNRSHWTNHLVQLLVLLFVGAYFPLKNVLLIAAAIVVIGYIKPSFKPFNLIGNYSYSLYLSHGLFGGTFMYFMSRNDILTNYPLLLLVSGIAFSLAASYGIYRLIEKPSLSWGKHIKYKQ